MKDSVTITIPSHPGYLSMVRDVTARFGEIHNLSEAVIADLKLGVDEACSNVIKYAYRGATEGEIVITLRIMGKDLEVIIEDEGVRADPACIEGRNLDDVRPGGLGLHLIKRAFHVYEFDEGRRSGNRLRLVRHLR